MSYRKCIQYSFMYVVQILPISVADALNIECEGNTDGIGIDD